MDVDRITVSFKTPVMEYHAIGLAKGKWMIEN
jgi:hypothetical protein